MGRRADRIAYGEDGDPLGGKAARSRVGPQSKENNKKALFTWQR
nr:MAG TPA: hypothetical protein [Caudoviricetes sp.]